MLGRREDVETEPYVARVLALDQPQDCGKVGVVDGQVRGVERASAEVREEVRAVRAVHEDGDREPGDDDRAR